MRNTKRIACTLLLTVIFLSFAAVPGFAADIKSKAITIDGNPHYQILVPNFIAMKKVQTRNIEGRNVEANVIVMQTPKKDKNGAYPIFEVVSTDARAYTIESFPETLADGVIGEFQGEFSENRVTYRPTFSKGHDLKDIGGDQVFIFDFTVYGINSAMIDNTEKLYFMFADKGGVKKPAKESTVKANPAASKIVVNGKPIAFEAYTINGSNYFKLRDLAMTLSGTEKEFEVDWDSVDNAISLTTGAVYTPDGDELAVSPKPTAKQAKPASSKIYVNGEERQFTAYNIGGSNYFKLRDIAAVIDFVVTWDAKSSTIGIDAGG